MSSPVISVEHLSKSYHLGQIGTGTLTNDLKVWSARVRGKPNPLLKIGQTDHSNHEDETLWALKDITFQVDQGDVLGIIGRNGAGKSTLLKILSRITAPTSGCVKVKGRIASLLEVGTGFHPDLTGRENTFLNGAILGMKKEEVQRKFDEIVAFSEIEKFIDTPVKRYSSGMYVRLAFAVAAHLDPEILIIDEVLAVGDAEFQKKCLGKMGDIAGKGRTVLFVSHNMTAIRNLTLNSLWIHEGKIKQIGESPEVIRSYLENFDSPSYIGEMDLVTWPNRYGNGNAKIFHVRLLDSNDNVSATMYRTKSMKIEFDFESNCNHALHFSSTIISKTGEPVLHLSHHDTPALNPGILQGKYRIQFLIPNLPLNEGLFSLQVAIHTDSLIPVDVVKEILPFNVFDIADSPRPYKSVTKYAYCWTPNNCSITRLR